MTSPLVSVVLSVRNGERDLPRALDSVFQQTFADFELIAINNGSRDGTAAILDALTDPRVRVVHQEDMGLAGALNRGIAMARGKYIARQDHDDISMPTRLQKQADFLEANPACALLGTSAEIWVGNEPADRFHDHPTSTPSIKFELLFNNPFVHSSVLLRASAVREVGGYTADPARHPPEDYELWSRLARRFDVANLSERLLIYREVPSSMSREGANPFQEKLVMISAENLAFAAGEEAPAAVHRDAAALTHGAHHLMSAAPDLERMIDAVRIAAARIANNTMDADLAKRIGGRVDALRHQFHLQLTARGMVKPIDSARYRSQAVLRRLKRMLQSRLGARTQP